ncbi:MAG: LysM peptidoglycan-binding domain-containing protein, partial [Firmicutes bacterium]|nr:LysM peptidoglycan-binding domain-containing protein [Bacillota bacterium]
KTPVYAQTLYTVAPGDTLYSIAQKHRTSAETIRQLNGLESNLIYAGQVLVIPDQVPVHIVAQGETLYRIAKLYDTTVSEIVSGNNLPDDSLRVGQVLRVANGRYRPPDALIIGYYTEEEQTEEGGYWPSSAWSTTVHMGDLSYVAPFWFRLNQWDCTDLETAGYFDESQVRRLVATAHAQNVRVIPVIHNFLYKDRSLTKDLVTEMLSSPESRKRCIEHIAWLIRFYGFDGVNMDFEGIRVSDRDKLSLFYQELGDHLRAKGYIFTVAVPAKSGDDWANIWAAPYDYPAIGRAADLVVLMMYNEHGWPGSGPGPVSSIGFNHAVLQYAVKRIPTHKIIVSEPVFGFDFNLQTGKNAYLSHEQAMQQVNSFGAAPLFDLYGQTPFFSYTAENQPHEVWYEDAESLKRKLDLIKQYDIAGMALWRLGLEDPAMWQTIRERVNIR